MSRTAEIFWIAAAAALAIVTAPIAAIVRFSAMALPVAVRAVRRQRHAAMLSLPPLEKARLKGPAFPPIFETTYMAVDRA